MKAKLPWIGLITYTIGFFIFCMFYLYLSLRNVSIVKIEEPLKISSFSQSKSKITIQVLNSDGSIPERIVVDFMDADDQKFATESIQVKYTPNGTKHFRFNIPNESLFSITPTIVRIRLP